MNTSDILNRAADLIEERGWTRSGGWFPESLPADAPPCLEGALKCAAREMAGDDLRWQRLHYGTGLDGTGSKGAMKDYLGKIPFVWNDDIVRTADEVIDVLRACALIESAREEQDAVWETYAEVVSA